MARFCMLILMSFAVFLPSIAMAANCDRNITVRSGKSTPLYWMGLYNTRTCQPARRVPQIGFKEKPKHGKVTSEISREKLGKKAGRCAGRPARIKQVIYTSKKGFRGRDSFIFRIGAGRFRDTCKINVRVR